MNFDGIGMERQNKKKLKFVRWFFLGIKLIWRTELLVVGGVFNLKKNINKKKDPINNFIIIFDLNQIELMVFIINGYVEILDILLKLLCKKSLSW